MQSAKNILLHNTIAGSKDSTKRKAKNEFQAYAYRLASDLNDLNRLTIYLKLSKMLDRSLLESAYSFVADASTSEKGKLFLWKLKKIREEIDMEKNKNNFSYEYFIKTQKNFKKIFTNEIILKYDSEITEELIQYLDGFINKGANHNLVLGNTSRRIIKLLDKSKYKSNVIELSCDINRANLSKKTKIISKDFLNNAFKDNYFNNIILNNFFSQIPFDLEIKYLKEVKRVLKLDGLVFVIFKESTTESQSWKDFDYRNKKYFGFAKSFSETYLNNQFEKFDFKLDSSTKFKSLKLNIYKLND